VAARVLMIQGTASGVGKSFVATALCRYFKNQGVKVAPFKAWNMSLNSFVTSNGLEMAKAQAVQAQACGIVPSVDMNPVLIKCESKHRMQIITTGQTVGSMTAPTYRKYIPKLKSIITQALDRLRSQYELIILEGAGSPAELNLQNIDLANELPAQWAKAQVILVGDIDRGGVFASLVGTIELLTSKQKNRILGLIINKFRGDIRILKPGIHNLEKRIFKPVLGVLPYLPNLRIPEEDAVSLDYTSRDSKLRSSIRIAIIRYPHLSNFDEFLPLERMSEVEVKYIQHPREGAGADLVILPGTKSTVSDLHWIRKQGFEAMLRNRIKKHRPILGICGGYQMMGRVIEDPYHIESNQPCVQGLGFLSVSTRFQKFKKTVQVSARIQKNSFLTQGQIGEKINAYEIHMGQVQVERPGVSLFKTTMQNQERIQSEEGSTDAQGNIVGTLLHGLFENHCICSALIHELGFLRNPRIRDTQKDMEGVFEQMAYQIDRHLSMNQIRSKVFEK
jgi:adenosylcobyric acid synthase